MEDKKLNRMFDRVKLSPEREEAMLAGLLTDKKEVSSMKQNRKRRIPAAALAAVLAVALAGTALAVEYFGKINIELPDDLTGSQGEWYGAHMSDGRIPVSSLSEELMAACTSADESGDAVVLTFGSRLDAEAFLGLELAGNARLERMPVGNVYYLDDTTAIQGPGPEDEIRYCADAQSTIQCPCLVRVTYTPEQVPAYVLIQASYKEGGDLVSELILFGTDAASDELFPGLSARIYGGLDSQEYVTPNGIEATVVCDDEDGYSAYFAKDNVFYSISGIDGWDMVKEVLDAYE